jgi:predicted PurR-regulated permease PerM
MKDQNFRSLLFLFISILLIYISFLMIKPYLITLISAFILAYLFFPVYKFQEQKLGFPKQISSLSTLILIFLLILIPFVYISKILISQVNNLLKTDLIQSSLEKFFSLEILQEINFSEFLNKFLSWFLEASTNFIFKIPSLIISIFILCFAIFYFFIEGENLRNKLIKYLPFKDKEKVSNEIAISTRQIVYGSLLIALIEFLFASFGFWFFGVQSYFLFAFIIAVLAFIPGIGPIVVWVPLAISFLVKGSWFNFFGIIVVGLITDLLINSFLRAKILNNQTNIHPLIMILGIFGGISVFGFFGIIIGPLLLVYTIKLVEQTFRKN